MSSGLWLSYHPQSYSWSMGHGRAHYLSDLAFACAFPPITGELALQVFDLPHIWSSSVSNVIEPGDVLAVAAAVFMFIKLHLSPQQRYPRTLPELLTAVAALLTRRQPNDAAVLHNAHTIAHVEIRDAGAVGL